MTKLAMDYPTLAREAEKWVNFKRLVETYWAHTEDVPVAVKEARKLIDAHSTLESYLKAREATFMKKEHIL